jgi:membrane protein YdbS with pleckstrin-like domain
MVIQLYVTVSAKIRDSGFYSATFEIANFYIDNYLIQTLVIMVGFGIVLYILDFYRNTIVYQILKDEIHVFRGMITKSHKVVPFRTITNIGIKRYPSDRLTGLATIEIHTAGGSSGSGILREKTVEQKIEGLYFDELKSFADTIILKIHELSKIQDIEISKDSISSPTNLGTKNQILNDILVEFKHIINDLQIN